MLLRDDGAVRKPKGFHFRSGAISPAAQSGCSFLSAGNTALGTPAMVAAAPLNKASAPAPSVAPTPSAAPPAPVITPAPTASSTDDSAAAANEASLAVTAVAAAAAHALQSQQTQISAQADAVAAAQQQQLQVNQQFAATNHASIEADALLQRQRL